jgi:hypothetical protein
VLLLDLAFAHRARQQDITNQKARSFIKADHRLGWIVGKCVKCQELFQASQKGSSDRANAPGLAAMRL